jgi:transcriptional regulator with XRE-family HTH domain
MDLESYRKKEKLTYRDLAKLLQIEGVSIATTALRWCKGERIPRAEHMKKIFKLTKGKVTPSDFYEGK